MPLNGPVTPACTGWPSTWEALCSELNGHRRSQRLCVSGPHIRKPQNSQTHACPKPGQRGQCPEASSPSSMDSSTWPAPPHLSEGSLEVLHLPQRGLPFPSYPKQKHPLLCSALSADVCFFLLQHLIQLVIILFNCLLSSRAGSFEFILFSVSGI